MDSWSSGHWCMNCQKPRLNRNTYCWLYFVVFVYGKYAFMLLTPIIYLKHKHIHIYSYCNSGSVCLLASDTTRPALSYLLPFRQIFSFIAKHMHILTAAFPIPVLLSIMFIPHIEKRPLNSSLCNETRSENTTCMRRLNDKREQKIGWDSHLLGMIKL